MPRAKKSPTEHAVITMARYFVEAELRQPDRECYFAIGRAWRFDLAWPEWMIAVEYEGASWVQGGAHNSGGGYRSDVDKYNEAAALGWCVIRVTADMVRDMAFLAPVLMAMELRKQGVVPMPLAYGEPVTSVDPPPKGLINKTNPWDRAEVGGSGA